MFVLSLLYSRIMCRKSLLLLGLVVILAHISPPVAGRYLTEGGQSSLHSTEPFIREKRILQKRDLGIILLAQSLFGTLPDEVMKQLEGVLGSAVDAARQNQTATSSSQTLSGGETAAEPSAGTGTGADPGSLMNPVRSFLSELNSEASVTEEDMPTASLTDISAVVAALGDISILELQQEYSNSVRSFLIQPNSQASPASETILNRSAVMGNQDTNPSDTSEFDFLQRATDLNSLASTQTNSNQLKSFVSLLSPQVPQAAEATQNELPQEERQGSSETGEKRNMAKDLKSSENENGFNFSGQEGSSRLRSLLRPSNSRRSSSGDSTTSQT